MAQDNRIPVGVLGATGSVGQRFIRLLDRHPWFRVAAVTASERSEGRPYGEAVQWAQDEAIPPEVAALPVRPTVVGPDVPIAFSALDASVAGPVETAFAASGVMVVTNARNHRMDPDVPLLVPEVNPDHLALLEVQDFPRGGGIIANPNCSTIGLVVPLQALHKAFGVRRVNVVTLQAISGAGIPGVSSMAIHDNVVPFISGEEEKLESETRKILGKLGGPAIEEAPIAVSAQCTRVPVLDGHLKMMSLELEGGPVATEVADTLSRFHGGGVGVRAPLGAEAGDPCPGRSGPSAAAAPSRSRGWDGRLRGEDQGVSTPRDQDGRALPQHRAGRGRGRNTLCRTRRGGRPHRRGSAPGGRKRLNTGPGLPSTAGGAGSV